jgi:hypothetical protein
MSEKTEKKLKFTHLSLKAPTNDGERYYSVESGALIGRYQQGFVVEKDGILRWIPDANLADALVQFE